MKTRKLFWLFALSIMAVIFAACGGDAANGGDGGNSDSGSSVELTQTETVEGEEVGGSLSVKYPEGWAAESTGGAILVGSSEEVLAIQDPTSADEIPAGAVVVNVSVIPAEMAGFMGLEADSTPADAIGVFTSFMSAEDGPTFSEPTDVDLNGTPASSITGADDNVSITLYAFKIDDNFVIAFGATRADEAGSQDATIQAIAASTEYTPAASGE